MEKQGRSGILFRCFKEHTKIGLDICAGTCYNIVRKCGHRTSASISAFQAEEVGSIPIARSMQKSTVALRNHGAFGLSYCFPYDDPACRYRSHLSHRALIWSANLARSLLAPPSLCSMTRSSRLPALTSRWKTVAARLALSPSRCSMWTRLPSLMQTAPSAPMPHCSPL